MKLLRYGEPGSQRPGILDDGGAIRDISSVIAEIGPEFLGSSDLARLRALDLGRFPKVSSGARLAAPVAGTSKIVCIGLNYADHAAESGLPEIGRASGRDRV